YSLIGDIIRLRKARGLTQAQLAAMVNTKQPAIARLESGRVTPSLESVEAIADALGAQFVCRLEPQGGSPKSRGKQKANAARR
ncbi:MAG TPA: helix-turn-helix transcriptional regulator, partial [Pseudorhizobium sp.]|nr:helix-turn-helix transcriptional regulator [Pseudorhizobium sp.]